ncbi:MAG: fimbrial biogenesis chaperone [Rhodospirillaceae bacterium]
MRNRIDYIIKRAQIAKGDREQSLSLFVWLALGLIALVPARAAAAPVSITPTTIVLGPGHTTALVSITNESDGPTRFETSVNAWSESTEGETSLTPSDEVVIFPQLIALAAHETKKVRIGTELPPAAAERSYRLILQELPQINRDTGRVEIQVLSKISLPVFVAPPTAQARPAVDAPNLAVGTLSFDVVNTGAAHFMLKQVSVTGRGAAGESFSLNTNGWYVLAGGRRSFRLTLAAADCKRTREIFINTTGDAAPAEARLPVPAGACGAASEYRFLKTGSAAPS